jgi:hypothetical protein
VLRKLRPRFSFANVTSLLALFVALGGSAYAAATIGAGDIMDDAVHSRHIADGQVFAGDLSPGIRTRELEYRRSNTDNGTQRTVLALGNLQFSASCGGSGDTYLTLYVKNISSQRGEMNAGLLLRPQNSDQAFPETQGVTLDPGAETNVLADGATAPNAPLLETYDRGFWDKAEGQLILRTPGRVTTVTFHAQATFVDRRGSYFDRKECNVDGTAVSATS